MKIYLLVILGLSLITAIAKSTGWRPKWDSNWHHIGDSVLILIGFLWLLLGS